MNLEILEMLRKVFFKMKNTSLSSIIPYKVCQYGCKDDSESHRDVTLEISSLRVRVKRSRGKKQHEETEKQ